MTAYYNEVDPFAAAWLRELIKAGHIADGEVDERDIRDIAPAELAGYTQCHFFAGIGVWSYALRRAGWPDDRQVWTGSCPCQPFSAAGKAGGFADERHLWPHWLHLIQHGKPKEVPIFGEQVASKDGLAWLDLVQTDLEEAGYACGAVDLCAAGVGAPHIRQRLFFVAERMADANSEQRERQPDEQATGIQSPLYAATETRERPSDNRAGVCGMADAERADIRGGGLGKAGEAQSGMQGADRERQRVRADDWTGCAALDVAQQPGPTNGLWRNADWLFCRDGKWRPVEPGTSPLAHGAAARVGRLRGYGNAINAEAAAAFIEAYLSIRHTVVPVSFL